jgi:hypothetical protein
MREMTRDEIRQAIINSIQELPEMEQKIVVLFFHEGLTFKEIGLVMDITELQTKRMCTNATRKVLRAYSMRFSKEKVRNEHKKTASRLIRYFIIACINFAFLYVTDRLAVDRIICFAAGSIWGNIAYFIITAKGDSSR